MHKTVTFSLDKETVDFIEEVRWSNRLTKSEFVREVLRWFREHPDELNEILDKMR